MNPVLILFGANAVAYNAAAALRTTSFAPVCLLPKNVSGLFRFSRWFYRVRRSKFTASEDGYCDDLIKFIRSFRCSRPVPALLTNDQAVDFWTGHHLRLSPYCTVHNERIDLFYRKDLFSQVLDNIGVEHPRTWSLADPPLCMPCLVKPAFKDQENSFIRHNKSKVLIVKDKNEYDQVRKDNPGELLCQEIIEYQPGDEFSWWGYRGVRGEVRSLVACHTAKYPDKAGRIARAELVVEPEVTAIGNRIVQQAGYTGIADIQMIRSRETGRFLVIEMNPRLWCSHELLLMNGVNFIRLCAEDYYETVTPEIKSVCLSGLKNEPTAQWVSVLARLLPGSPAVSKNTEFYGIEKENILTRMIIRVFICVKLIYYGIYRRAKAFRESS